ncbi:MAG: AAA family ATPase [Bacteroidales bacterium]|nr:AAA family ATPase [Bacteroidales bacterium]
MARERLSVRNFGPITDLDIEIRPFTLFIGTQGSGKSTISKLLTICRDVRWWLQILKEDNVMKPFVDFGINEYFHEDSYFLYILDDQEIKYEKGVFSSKLKGENNKEKIATIWKNLIAKNSASFLENNGLTVDNLSDPLTLNVLNANNRMYLYILAERNLVGNLSDSLASIMLHQIPLSNPLLEYMSMFEKAKKEFPTYDIPFFGVKFVKNEGKERIDLIGKNRDIPLSACSSGLQSALPMLMVIDFALKTNCFNCFVIEEPEQNLFPENQREVLGFFAKRLNNNRAQFILTTHSPYLLSCLNVLMLAYKLFQYEEIRKQVEEIVNLDVVVNPNDVAVYSLNTTSNEPYCKSLISEKNGFVSVNELDSVSEIIGDDFDRLYGLYRQINKK